MGEGDAERRRQREPHRAGAPARYVRPRPVPVDELRGPHLMLPDVGHHSIGAALVECPVQFRIDVVRHERGTHRAHELGVALLIL